MRRTIVVSLLLACLSLTAVGCRERIDGIEYELIQGQIAGVTTWHDVNFTNKSGRDLHEVKVAVTLIGESGEPMSEPKYYVSWPDGQTYKVSFPYAKSPVNVQKVRLAGSCDEGSIDYTWIPAQP